MKEISTPGAENPGMMLRRDAARDWALSTGRATESEDGTLKVAESACTLDQAMIEIGNGPQEEGDFAKAFMRVAVERARCVRIAQLDRGLAYLPKASTLQQMVEAANKYFGIAESVAEAA